MIPPFLSNRIHHHLSTSLNSFPIQRLIKIGIHPVITITIDDVVSSSMLKTIDSCRSLTAILLIQDYYRTLTLRVSTNNFIKKNYAIIWRAIVHKDKLNILQSLFEKADGALLNIFFCLIDKDNH